MIADIAKYARGSGYEISVLFPLGEGPLVAAMRDAGISASAVSWTGGRRDLAGAWRVGRWLREHPAQIAHLHHGGRSVRAVCRLAGMAAVVQHVHGRITETSGAAISQRDFRAVDAVIACSQAVADCLPGLHAEKLIYAGVETSSQP